ncbi:TAP42-like protein [Mycotypha africana]|uniref:TAP42-like protein n=1 Tax=Mycotypha africana TaxID=64632 RepID=UPI002300E772|nr:TAP42-like protein [Mycotypha africana]KAI8987812.1 TAP42-like protein [Mycotypha africana]
MTSVNKQEFNNLSLGQLFNLGQSIASEIENSTLSSTDPEYQQKVTQGLSYLQRADDLISKLHIFSDNELIDEMSPSEIKFMLVPAYLGDLTLKKTTDPSKRAAVLMEAKEYIQRFINQCQDYQLVSKQDLIVKDQLTNTVKSSISASQQREQKIARYKREKAVKENIKELKEKLNYIGAKSEEEKDRDMEDTERELAEALIDLEILKAFESWHSIEQELVMVKEMEEMREMMERKGHISGDTVERVQANSRQNWGRNKPLLNKQGRPLQPFVILSKREQLKNQVFGYSHNLPTMTIDDYLEQERERGNIIEGGGKEPEEKPPIDDNDYDAQDAETMKQREWDEFVEANPRGAGNRMNKG